MDNGVCRRSFLAIVAAALGVKPEKLAAIPASRPPNRLPMDWFRFYMFMDEVIIQPGEPINARLFVPPHT
jgi:hypothetical protein